MRFNFALYSLFVGFVYFSLICLPTSLKAQGDTTKTKKMSFSLYPAIGYQPETSLMLGAVGFFVLNNSDPGNKEHYRPSNFSPYVIYTLNNQILSAVDIELYLKNGYSLQIKPRYFNYPDFFFGIGDFNSLDDEEIYTNEFFQLEGRFLKFLDNKWSAGLRFDIQYNNLYDFDENGQLINGDYVGLDGGMNVGLGPSFRYDTRDNILYPSKGSFITTEITFYSKALGGDYSYALINLDIRKFISVKNEKNILAFQAVGNFTSGDDIPFYKLQKIGGDSRLRGIANENLYLDNQSFWMQAEYRRYLFWRFSGVAFAGLGEVASDLGSFTFDGLKYVMGVGGRFQAIKGEKMNVRLDLGFATGGQSAFYLSVREAF